MKIENNSSIDILKQANLQKVQKAAQDNMKKQERFPIDESRKNIRRDEYIPSEKDESIGLYNMEYGENGLTGIKFDSPENKPADKPEQSDKPENKPEEPEKPEKEKSESEECTCDTGKVDRELKKLREKAERLEQKLRSASGEEADKLRKQLAAAQSELAQKDNDTYRRSRAEFS